MFTGGERVGQRPDKFEIVGHGPDEFEASFDAVLLVVTLVRVCLFVGVRVARVLFLSRHLCGATSKNSPVAVWRRVSQEVTPVGCCGGSFIPSPPQSPLSAIRQPDTVAPN